MRDPAITPSLKGTPPSPRARLEHAMLLIARVHGSDAAAAGDAREALERWRAAHPEHESAYGVARAGWEATSAEALRGELPLPASGRDQRRASRRRVMSVLGLGALLAGVGSLARWHWLQPLQRIALSTPRGRIQATTLQDGSGLTLDARTRVRVALYRDRREAWLDEGEVQFSVTPDPGRPFHVMTPWGRVQVLGTVFTVEARHDRMRVAVAHGRVAVWAGPLQGDAVPSAQAQAADAVLEAGQSVTSEAGALAPVQRVAATDVGAWRQGWLVFDNTTLPQAVARWNDYLATPLQLADDPALRRLRLTGSFPLRSPGAFVDSLPGILPVRTERAGDGSVRILARR